MSPIRLDLLMSLRNYRELPAPKSIQDSGIENMDEGLLEEAPASNIEVEWLPVEMSLVL